MGTTAPVYAAELPEVHRTRQEMIEPEVRAALDAAPGRPRRGVDLGCHEGWFTQRLLEWGADEALGVDIRELNIRRARLLRDHHEIPHDRLDFVEASVFDVDPGRLGTFDVVLVLGLIYHLEDPVGALRVARRLCRGLCAVETQVTRQRRPIRHGWGGSGQYEDEPASWASRLEPADEQEASTVASSGGVLSLIPNLAALLQALEAAGFKDTRVLEPHGDHNFQYRNRDRAVVVAR